MQTPSVRGDCSVSVGTHHEWGKRCCRQDIDCLGMIADVEDTGMTYTGIFVSELVFSACFQ